MGAGKDFAYKTMQKFVINQVMRVSFADGLRNEVVNTLGLTETPTKPYTELERKLFQWWGTDYRRAQDPDYWVTVAEEQAIRIDAAGFTPVFTDVRFPNEADMIVKHGGLLVQVMAGAPIREMRLGMPPPTHESETALDNYSWPLDTYILFSAHDGPDYDNAVKFLLKAADVL